LFWKSIVGISNEIDLNQFAASQAILLFIILILLLVERMLYRTKGETGIAKHRLTIKLFIFAFEVIVIHFLFTYIWPYKGMRLSDYLPIKVYYIFWLSHFYFSAK